MTHKIKQHLPLTKKLIQENWKSGLTVAFISIPLSIALSIASGAGPLPGLVTGIWATFIASIFGGSNYNVVGAAGALTTVLFAATLNAPTNLGPLILPFLAITTGIIIFFVWLLRADRFLYYVPSSVIYGFSGGVAFMIAASQLFDAAGLSTLKRTGDFIDDITLFITHISDIHFATLITFFAFLIFILAWKHWLKKVPAVIPVSILGILFGYFEVHFFDYGLISLGDKFGEISGALALPIAWQALPTLLSSHESIIWLGKTASIIALIAILETLITARIGDKLTRTQSSPSRELFGLSLANIGSGIFGGLPATGVFIRAGANIKAKATHKASATMAALFTAVIAVIALPYFIYIPMAVIAAILINTALGLIETDKIKEFWSREKHSFWIALVVVVITVFEDAGMAVLVGILLALFAFADSISHGRFDAILNFKDGERSDIRGAQNLHLPHGRDIEIFTYSIAGFLGYIDSARHAANLHQVAHSQHISHVILRLRDLYAMDFEGEAMLKEAIGTLNRSGKQVYISSASEKIITRLSDIPFLTQADETTRIFKKTSDVLLAIRTKN